MFRDVKKRLTEFQRKLYFKNPIKWSWGKIFLKTIEKDLYKSKITLLVQTGRSNNIKKPTSL